MRKDLKADCSPASLNSIYKDIAELVGMENAITLFNEFRGQQITFPVEFYSKQYVYKCIREEFDGSNLRTLALKYGYSECSVRRILKEEQN